MVSARPLFGPAGAGAMAAIVAAQTRGAERFSRMVSFFDGVTAGIATGVFFLVYQQIENYLVYPRVMSRSVDVNPAAAIVGALIGGTLLGFVGALLAVPAPAAIQLILREVLVPRQDAQ